LNEEVMRALKLKASRNYPEADAFTKLSADRALRTTLPLFMQNTRRDILATVLIAADGSAFVTSVGGAISEPVAGYPYTEQDWYRKALQADGKIAFIGAHAQDYLLDTPRQRVLSVARLIKDPDTRQSLGVIMADADTVVLARIVSEIHFHVSSIVCIFDSENKLLYASRPLSDDIQRQVLAGDRNIRSAGDGFVAISKPISPAQWKVIVLLSNAEIAAKTRWWYIAGILFATGGLVLTFLLFFALSRWIIHPFRDMISVMDQVRGGNLQTRFQVTGSDEIAELGQALNSMIERLNQLIDQEYKAVINQRNAEYRALQSQIQPHFLYNTLNSFIGLNRLKDSLGLEKAIFALSGMLHYILEGEEWVQLEDELTFLKKYCDLQKLRFRDRLAVSIQCDRAIQELKIPKLLLQPLVENAMIHGIEPAGRACRLDITADLHSRDGSSRVQISVQDDGCGFDPLSLPAKKGFGLANIRERLDLAFPEATFSMISQAGIGTKTTIEIPCHADFFLEKTQPQEQIVAEAEQDRARPQGADHQADHPPAGDGQGAGEGAQRSASPGDHERQRGALAHP
jgi:two-component system sensor histidine kinase YesM